MIQITTNWGIEGGDHIMGWIFGSDYTRPPVHSLTSFSRMELRRDNIVVEPVRVAYSTSRNALFEYPPEAFTPGAKVVLRVWREDAEWRSTERLNQRLLNSITRNFELYYEAMSSE
jgi:hypothetical protein